MLWNRSPAQVGYMGQVLRAGALGRPRGMGWGGRREGGSGWGTHVNPWLIHVNVWQKPLQYCYVISLQLIRINGKNKIKYPYYKKILLLLSAFAVDQLLVLGQWKLNIQERCLQYTYFYRLSCDSNLKDTRKDCIYFSFYCNYLNTFPKFSLLNNFIYDCSCVENSSHCFFICCPFDFPAT